MPLSALLVDNGNATFYNGDAACQIPITPASETGVILGNSPLRFAYLVYYIENNEIAVAQAVLDATSTSNIVTIPSSTGLPGVSPTATLILSDITAAATAATVVPGETSSVGSGNSLPTPTFNLGASTTASSTGSTQSSRAGAGLVPAS